jgi:hypothetical protein
MWGTFLPSAWLSAFSCVQRSAIRLLLSALRLTDLDNQLIGLDAVGLQAERC